MDKYTLQRIPEKWKQETTYRVYPSWLRKKEMPRIDDTLLDCVFYIYASEQDAMDNAEESAASGFFIMIPSEVNENMGYLYAVTNIHVVSLPHPIIRINTKEGLFETFPTDTGDWIRHPNGDDIAVYPVSFVDWKHHSVSHFHREHILTEDFMEKQNVGIGDDVFMVGRFRGHSGQERNLPSGRFGNIAMMPEEPIYNKELGYKIESFLVEMRSVSGFSGSPVIIEIPPMSNRKREVKVQALSMSSEVRLLGIDWGHIATWEKAKDNQNETFKVQMNSAMAGVVPSWKLFDLLDGKELKEKRRKDEGKLKKEMDEAPFVVDGELGDGEFTKEDMEDALKKAFKPEAEDQTSDEGKSETSE